MNKNIAHPVIDLMQSQKNIVNKGGTMRLGSWECELSNPSIARDIYSSNVINERHRHRYEFNNDYLDQFQSEGLLYSHSQDPKRIVPPLFTIFF
jgi:CTP synthase